MSENVTIYAGLDYHQNSIQVCLMDQTGKVRLNKACKNDVATISELLKSSGDVRAVALEACCGAADLAEQLVSQGSWRVELTFPTKSGRAGDGRIGHGRIMPGFGRR